MTIHHCDLDLGTGANDGTSWADAFKTIVLASTTASNGDIVYTKGTASQGTSDIILAPTSVNSNRKSVDFIGVKAATTNEGGSIVQSDLIPGLWTGDATRAYDQVSVNAPPEITVTGAAIDIRIDGKCNFYGFKVSLGGLLRFQSGTPDIKFEECEITMGTTDSDGGIFFNTPMLFKANNCKFVLPASGRITWSGGVIFCEMTDCIFAGGASITNLFKRFTGNNGGAFRIRNCDFSAITNLTEIFANSAEVGFDIQVTNCKVPSGCVIMATATDRKFGAVASGYAVGSNPGSPLGSDESFLDGQITALSGIALQETTAVRTNGASDEASGAFSWALTPTVDFTVELWTPLWSPWLRAWIEGDGSTGHAVTVYIANDGAADYFDDDVVLEVYYPSEDGNPLGAMVTTRAEILATPVVIADDVVSAWGTGASNFQKLVSPTITPDYSGPILARVGFYKAFAASPETLFIDPLMDTS